MRTSVFSATLNCIQMDFYDSKVNVDQKRKEYYSERKEEIERKIGNELSDGIDILVELMAKRVVH